MEINQFTLLFNQYSERLPAYRRIKDLITTQISLGELTSGSQIPSENEFVDALGISRMTVNRAMRELAAEGVLTRARGVGTFIAEPQAPGIRIEVHDVTGKVRQRSKEYAARVLTLEELKPESRSIGWGPGQIPGGLGSRIIHSLIVHLENGEPIQLEERFVNADEIPEYINQDFSSITPDNYLMRVAPPVHGTHEIEAVQGSPEECKILGIDPATPCLQVKRYAYSQTGLVSAARLLHPARVRLEGEFGA